MYLFLGILFYNDLLKKYEVRYRLGPEIQFLTVQLEVNLNIFCPRKVRERFIRLSAAAVVLIFQRLEYKSTRSDYERLSAYAVTFSSSCGRHNLTLGAY